MTTIYRTNGLWGSGKGSPLTWAEVDNNFYGHELRIAAIEGSPPVAVSIASITQSGNEITVHLTDSSMLGPFSLEVPITFRGAWQPSTTYVVGDWITGGGGVYFVGVDHTSATAFDPLATDGLGHNLYEALLEPPAQTMATGGATRQVLMKSSTVDFASTWGWVASADVTFTSSTSAGLSSTNVSDALDELAARVVATTLDDLDGVVLSGVSLGQYLQFNGTDWANVTLAVTLSQMAEFAVISPALNEVLTYDGTHWVNQAAQPTRFPTITALGTSGAISLDPTLGEVFTIAPTADVTITPASYPAGAHVTLVITTANASAFAIAFSGSFRYLGDIKLPAQSGVSLSISFISDGFYFNEVARTGTRKALALATSGTVSVDPTFTDLFTVTPAGAITFNATSAPVGRRITFVFTTSGTSSYVMTFGTSFKSTGTLATGVTTAKVFTVTFVGDGTNFNEISRTTAM